MQYIEARNYIEFSEKDRNFFQRVFFSDSIFSFLFFLFTSYPILYFSLGSVKFEQYCVSIIIFMLFAWIFHSLYWSIRYTRYLNYIRFVDDKVLISHYLYNKKVEEEFNIKDLSLKLTNSAFSLSSYRIIEFKNKKKYALTVESYGGRFSKYWSEEDLDRLYNYFIEYQKKYLDPQDK